jgi:alpha-tubulin suppressor-like RCC1 family protein
MNHRNPLSPFAHKAQVLMRAFSPRSPALRAALTGTTLGLAALAFAAPLITNGGSSLPEIGIDAGPALVAGTAANSGFSGTCSENLQTISLKIRHRVSGQLVEAPVVPCAGGVWQVTGIDLSGLNDGPLLLLAKHEDLAGQPTELSASLLKGSPAPRLGIDAPALIHPGNLESYRLSGTCSEEGRTIALTLNDAQGYRLAPTPLPTCSGQHWSTALSGLAALNDGVITLTVTHGEANTQGEIATLSAQALKNVALPGLSIDPLLFVKTANQRAFPVSGTCSEAQQPVSLSVSDRNKVTAYGVALCSGKGWRLPALDLSALADGELRFIATHARAQPVVRTVMQAGLKDTAATVTSNGNAATLTPSASAPLTGNSTSTKAQSSLLQTQTLSFNRLTNKTLANLPFSVAATASSGLPVSFSSLTPLVCTATGSQGATVSLLLLGTCTLQANQAGNSQYAAATPVQQSFTVGIAAADAMMGNPAIAAGGNHTIAIKVGGTVWTWGDNERGQLGDGTTTMHSTPVQVPNLSADGVGAGASHSVALQKGTIFTWGNNDFGQLGNGTGIAVGTDSKVPVALSSLPPFSAIAVGANHTLALSGGKVWAWGANGDGQLGNNTQTDSATPVQVLDSTGTALTGVQEIAAGANHSLALKNDGTVWAWGRNTQGQLGDSTTTDSAKPVQVKMGASNFLTGITAIAAGGEHSLALDGLGNVWAWGGNWTGQIGQTTNPTQPNSTPGKITSFTSVGVKAIAAGNAYSLALDNNGKVWAWGYGSAGQVGSSIKDNPHPETPVLVASASDVTRMAAGDNHAVAMKVDGTVLAWGYNGRGQLGDGKLTFRQEAVSVIHSEQPNGVKFGPITAGAYHFLAKTTKGTDNGTYTPSVWGSNWRGQLASSTTFQDYQTPGDVFKDTVAAGYGHTLIAQRSQTQAVGGNWAGQLGDETTIQKNNLVTVLNLTGVSTLAAGGQHSLAIRVDSNNLPSVVAWGANDAGQLGNSTTTPSTSPVNVNTALSGATAVAAGYAHSVALKTGGTVWTWGSNLFGQLGVSGTTNLLIPTQVLSLGTATQIAAGMYHTLALVGGSVWAWGSNSVGQLGDGTTTDRYSPIPVSGLPASITKIVAGAHHSLAMNDAGKVWIWGRNDYGQLGNASLAYSRSPLQLAEVTAADTAADIAAGLGYSAILTTDGKLRLMGDGRDGELGLGSSAYATAIRPTPTPALLNLATGPNVSLSLTSQPTPLTPTFTVTSSLAGMAYWKLVRSTENAPTLVDIKKSCTSVCPVVVSAATATTIPPGTLVAGAYRLFVCVVKTGDSACTGNAASLDFVTTAPPTPLPTADLTVVVTGSAGFVTSTANNAGEVIYCDGTTNAAASTTCKKSYLTGQSVTLRATKTSSRATVTVTWSGGVCSGSGDTCIVTLSAATTVKAAFTQTDVGGTVQFPQASYTATAGKTTTITINRTGNTDNPASITIACAPSGSSNCSPFPTTLSFVAGQSSANYTFTSSSAGAVTLTLSAGTGNPTIGSTKMITVNLRKSVSLTPILMLLLD